MAAGLLALAMLPGHADDGAFDAAGLRYLALGDSYTIGEGVAEDGRWPLQLARALRAEGIALADPRIVATTGWTTDELAAAIDAADIASATDASVEAVGMEAASLGATPAGAASDASFPPQDDDPGRGFHGSGKSSRLKPLPRHAAAQRRYDFVSLLIGVNNQYRGRGLDEYRVQFAALLERAIGFVGGDAGRVLVLSIPDWGATRFGRESGRDVAAIARELDAFNAAAHAACAARGVAFVDITALSRVHGADASMLADDGLHPSARAYAGWARQALPVARRLLAPR